MHTHARYFYNNIFQTMEWLGSGSEDDDEDDDDEDDDEDGGMETD
jgi:hypothetical protein